MRWLFLFVLLLNLVYVGWEMSQPAEEFEVPIVERNVPKIVLLSEIGQESVDKGMYSSDNNNEERTASTGGCYTLGPFRDLEKLRAVTRGISKYITDDASFRSHEEKEQTMFWVYLEPDGGYEKALSLATELKTKNVKDYFIIKSGPKNNGISLGHYRDKDRAYAHARHIGDLGFRAEVEAVFKIYIIYWLDFEVISGVTIPEDVFSKYLTSDINRLVRECG
ncbi:MAG: hypothetical protein OEZ15_07280 [Gammaproteobacteria bacterium]|nr:hypothetical protein [Gammaproteobacteria bacterium]